LLLQGETPAAAVNGVAIALLLPAFAAAGEAAGRNRSQNNLKEIGLGILNYEDRLRHLPARAIFDASGKPLLSWRVELLPELGHKDLYDQFHLNEPWDSEHNRALIDKMPDVYKHPHFNERGKTLYQAVVGPRFAFEGNQGTRLAGFLDGMSKTILVVEVAPSKAVPWAKPEDWTPDERNPMKDLGGLFAGDIFNALFADCHVDGISKSLNPTIFKAMLTRNGREKVEIP
jgi:Protein of unknown function (DUF1559)